MPMQNAHHIYSSFKLQNTHTQILRITIIDALIAFAVIPHELKHALSFGTFTHPPISQYPYPLYNPPFWYIPSL